MRKQKFVKTLLVTTLCTAMAASTCFAGATTGGGELSSTAGSQIEGVADVINPVYKVVVPTNLTFSIDPFSQKGQSQIYSEDLPIINKSNVPVRVNVNVKVEPKDATVTLVETEAKVSETNSDKIIYMAAQVPTAIAETKDAAAAYTTPLEKDGSGKYYDASDKPGSGTTVADEMVNTTNASGTYTDSVKTTLDSIGVDMLFALQKADYVEYFKESDASFKGQEYKQTAASEEGTAVFRFWGKVNSKAEWAAADVKATAKYTFLGLSSDNYDALKGLEVDAEAGGKAHGYVAENAAPTFTSTTAGEIAFTAGSGTAAFKEIVAVNATYSGAVYDVYNAGSTWVKGVVDGSKVTLDSNGYSWLSSGEFAEVEIVYTAVDDSEKKATINLKIK